MTRALLEQALDALEDCDTAIKHLMQPAHPEVQITKTSATDVMKAISAHLSQPQGEPVAAAGEDLAIYQSIADNYFKSIRPAHTEAEVQEIFNAAQQAFNPTNYGYHQRDFGNVVRRILGVPAP